jgi:hypothetical protein
MSIEKEEMVIEEKEGRRAEENLVGFITKAEAVIAV